MSKNDIRIEGDKAFVKVRNLIGEIHEFVIDAGMVNDVSKFRWAMDRKGYAYTTIKIGLHQLINQTPSGFVTDHIDQNPKNNLQVNLRTTTYGKNRTNCKANKNIRFDPKTNKWLVYFNVDGIRRDYGSFDSEELATQTANEIRQKILEGDTPKSKTKINKTGYRNVYKNGAMWEVAIKRKDISIRKGGFLSAKEAAEWKSTL